jgi:hypothetical protein
MTGVYGTVRLVIRAGGEIQFDETVPNTYKRIEQVGKSFDVEVMGVSQSIDVEFQFDPPLKTE